MNVRTLVVFAAATIAASCVNGPGTPTAPSASAATSESSASNQESLLLTKTCDPIEPHCTVQTSSAGPIPVDSDIEYFGPLLADRTTSRIVVTTPAGDTATGNCSLSYRTLEGTCVLTSGTGTLVGLHANVKVFESAPGVFTWEGQYRFAR